MTDMLIVAATTPPGALAGAIAGQIREKKHCLLQAVGAGALNQAIKAIATARGYTISSGIDLVCTPTFSDFQANGETKTAIRLKVEPRS
jgi:stage V sporulation protein S